MKIAICYQGYEDRALFASNLMARAREYIMQHDGSEIRIFEARGMHIKGYAGKSDWSGWQDKEYIKYKGRYTSLLRNKAILEAIEWEPELIISTDDDMIFNPKTISLLAEACSQGHQWSAPIAHRLGYARNQEKHPAESSNINLAVGGRQLIAIPARKYIHTNVTGATEVYGLAADLARRMSEFTNGNFFCSDVFPPGNSEVVAVDVHGFLSNMYRMGQECWIVDDDVIRYTPHITPLDEETYERLLLVDAAVSL